MAGKRRLRIRLRLSIALVAALIIVSLTSSIIGFLFLRNARLAVAVAAESMDKATAKLSDSLEGLFNPVARVVEATAVLAKIDRGGLHRVDSMRFLLTELEALPQVDNLYIGFATDGAFYEVLRLGHGIEQFGPNDARPPAAARFALRLLDASSGEAADSFIYLARWGEIVGVERGPVKYDPRRRPWYLAAWEVPDTTMSDAYIFASSGRPGVTLSHRVATDEGVEIGTVGADISLDVFSRFLHRERIGRNGIVFVLDDDGRVIGQSNINTGPTHGGKTVGLPTAKDLPDQRIAEAVRLRAEGQANRFSAEIGGETYLVSFAPVAENFGRKWMVGAIAAQDDFVGPIRRSSLQMLAFGGVVLALALAGVLWGSLFLTRPIHKIVNETKRIREFDLSGHLDVNSFIVEIDDLTRAVQAMKHGLASFGAYVPKNFVRTIVASGKGTQIGGERRALTILFTDIQGFTQTSDALEPEVVLTLLSQYFEALSGCIHAHGGTVDKFIGDAIMAIWNAPLDDPDHVANACSALLACRAASKKINADFAARGSPPMPTRFGLHTGDVVVGNVGSTERMQYTALGDAVNLASRIEGLNKYYGTQLLVTGAVRERVQDRFLFRWIDLVVPAGTSRPVELFELLAPIDRAPDGGRPAGYDWLRDWDDALAVYRRQQWIAAVARFRSFKEAHPEDPVAGVYVERCVRFLTAPPPADWDGAERYDRK